MPAHPHDFVGVGDAFKIETAARTRLGVFRRDHERLVTRPKTGPDDERAIAADVGLNEVARESLRLRLSTDENCDAENDSAQAQKQCTLAMRQKTQGNVKWGCHRAFGGGGAVDHALAHRLTGTKLVLIGNDYVIAFGQATERLGKIQSAKSYVDGSSLHNSPIYHQRLVDKKSARRHEQGIFVNAGNDVHLPGHSDHHVVGRIFHLQHNGIALRGWIGCRLH